MCSLKYQSTKHNTRHRWVHCGHIQSNVKTHNSWYFGKPELIYGWPKLDKIVLNDNTNSCLILTHHMLESPKHLCIWKTFMHMKNIFAYEKHLCIWKTSVNMSIDIINLKHTVKHCFELLCNNLFSPELAIFSFSSSMALEQELLLCSLDFLTFPAEINLFSSIDITKLWKHTPSSNPQLYSFVK